MAEPPAAPTLTYAATISVRVGIPLDLLQGQQGHRRLVAITGGEVVGPLMSGEVLPIGMDNQILWTDSLTELRAQYALRLDDGALVYIDNAGIRTGEPSDIAGLVRGERVDPARIYFRTVPRLSSASPAWKWLDRTLFLGVGTREPDNVRIDLFQVG